MSEFDFLRKMYHRLSEAEGFAADAKHKKQTQRAEAWEVAALSIECSVKDYLHMRAAIGRNREAGGS